MCDSHQLQCFGSSGLLKIMAKQRHNRTRAPVDNTACVSDWIGGFCPAESLMIWFPAHGAPQVIKELERKEQDHRARFPQWFEQWVPNKYWQQQQDACASRTLQFQKLSSPIELLTASIRVDWFSLPVQCFLHRMPQLRQGLIRGVFLAKASSPCGVVTSLNVSKCPCVCPMTETLTRGMMRCMHCQLRGRMLLTSAPTISRRPLPISSLPFAPSWGCFICGGNLTPMAPTPPSPLESWPQLLEC